MNFLRGLRLIIGPQTFIITFFAVLATYFARKYEITAEFPLTLIGIAVVFPIVFSIAEAYKRREKALDQYGALKAHGRVIFFASRDWVDDDSSEIDAVLKRNLRNIFEHITSYFNTVKEDQRIERENVVYKDFSELSHFILEMRNRGLSAGELSRVNQSLSKMITAFESMKHIFLYRTPRTLRIYSKLFVIALPIIYSPYFAYVSLEYANGLEYVMPILFSFVFVGLDNIQDQLENPFDLRGLDDVILNAKKFAESLK